MKYGLFFAVLKRSANSAACVICVLTVLTNPLIKPYKFLSKCLWGNKAFSWHRAGDAEIALTLVESRLIIGDVIYS